MSYIGRNTDKISNIEILDNITFDGSSSYSITKSSVAFVPNSAQSCLISIDGVVQATNFTVSTSTIDFGVAIAGTSTCDFFLHYGTGLITVPADGTVTSAKITYPLTTFSSTGIDDNATANALTIDSSSNLQFNSGFGSVATAYGVRAWVYFNGTGVVAINGDGNVTSITDNGTGDYTVNFTTAMPDINFCVQHCARISGISNRTITQFSGNLSSASSVSLLSRNYSTNTAADPDMFHVAVFR
jgi:hypothetical protein